MVIQGGINDIVQGRPVEDAANDLACMADRARDAGLEVALVEVLPWNNGFPDAAPQVRDLNDRIHELSKAGGVPILPFFSTLEDPKRRDRMPANRTQDGNHPNVAGYRDLGERAWIEPTLPKSGFGSPC